MKQLLGLFVLAASVLQVTGQVSKPIAAIQRELQDARTDSARAALRIGLGWAYRNTTPDSDLKYVSMGLASLANREQTAKLAELQTQRPGLADVKRIRGHPAFRNIPAGAPDPPGQCRLYHLLFQGL
jgi:hypothetical protein